jgi:hypothetical protein
MILVDSLNAISGFESGCGVHFFGGGLEMHVFLSLVAPQGHFMSG